MSAKTDNAKKVADQSTEWFRDNIRRAYIRGWEDAERNMYAKADALLEVLKTESEEVDNG